MWKPRRLFCGSSNDRQTDDSTRPQWSIRPGPFHHRQWEQHDWPQWIRYGSHQYRLQIYLAMANQLGKCWNSFLQQVVTNSVGFAMPSLIVRFPPVSERTTVIITSPGRWLHVRYNTGLPENRQGLISVVCNRFHCTEAPSWRRRQMWRDLSFSDPLPGAEFSGRFIVLLPVSASSRIMGHTSGTTGLWSSFSACRPIITPDSVSILFLSSSDGMELLKTLNPSRYSSLTNLTGLR